MDVLLEPAIARDQRHEDQDDDDADQARELLLGIAGRPVPEELAREERVGEGLMAFLLIRRNDLVSPHAGPKWTQKLVRCGRTAIAQHSR